MARATGFISRRSVLAAAVAGTALLASWSPASAQTTGAGTTDAAPNVCEKLGPTNAGVQCAMRELDKRIAADRAAAASAREQDACGKYLLQGVSDRKWTLQEILVQANGKFTPENVCGVARQRGYGRSAALN